MFTKVLIANRGEIALRIIRTLRDMGIRSVAVYADVDRDSLHVQLADEAICIGGARLIDSYLDKVAILQAALVTGAQAIHPGFGFLSENASFAKMCQDYGVTFIGPEASVIEALGDKIQARKLMQQAGVPVIPGSEGAVESVKEAQALAAECGYPVLIKASAGGGGKGMRQVDDAESLDRVFPAVKLEAAHAFGDDAVYLEKAVLSARHIEVQILADQHGRVVHLGERDCSLQRNKQKVIEEAPAPHLSDELRERLGAIAVRAAEAAGYTNAGTVEFLVDEDNNAYFMEMNTRIQVEHAVTEMITGLDLIAEQIRIAAGEPLSFKQEDVVFNGHAIECRVYAEDPDNNFRPGAGQVSGLHLPGGFAVRVDSALYEGCDVLPFYDALIARLIVHGKDRAEAIARMDRALTETLVGGINNNVDWLRRIVANEDYRRGGLLTTWLNNAPVYRTEHAETAKSEIPIQDDPQVGRKTSRII